MLFNPFEILQRRGRFRALGRPRLAPPLPFVLAFHVIRGYARHRNTSGRPRRFASIRSEQKVAVDGKWMLMLATPMGQRSSILNLKTEGGVLTGRQSADGNSAEIFDGIINGHEVAWKVSITTPMPLTLDFEGTVEDNVISGEVGAGAVGCFRFRATRT
jgi:hypothetical protein